MLAPSLPFLIFSRCIEALGGTLLVANSNAIITLIFEGERRGKYLGINAAVVALGGLLGPAVGGFIIEYFSWNYIFLPAFLVGVIGVVGVHKLFPEFPHHEKENLDIAGFLFFAIALISLFLVLSCYNTFYIVKKFWYLFLVVSAIFWFLFHDVEKHVACPIISFELFQNKTFLQRKAFVRHYLNNEVQLKFLKKEIYPDG